MVASKNLFRSYSEINRVLFRLVKNQKKHLSTQPFYQSLHLLLTTKQNTIVYANNS